MSSKNPQGLAPYLDFDAVVCTRSLGANHKLKPLVESATGRNTVSKKRASSERPYFWGAERYRFDQSKIYQGLSKEKKDNVLTIMTRHFLWQGAAIENAGISHAAKMIVLSETVEEKMLYSIVAGDEATHLREFQNFIDFETPRAMIVANPFLKLLQQTIQNGSSSVCRAFVQVVLEGFGMHFYNDLKNDCLDLEFKQVLGRILKDEAVHHGSGVVMVETMEFDTYEKAMIRELFNGFALTTQGWALPLVSALEHVAGHLSDAQKAETLAELDMESKTHQRLQGLRMLLNHGKLLEMMGEPWVSGVPKPYTIPQVLELEKAFGR